MLLREGATIEELVRVLAANRFNTRDIIAIVQSLRKAGVEAEVEVI